jgi:hypothetical protein
MHCRNDPPSERGRQATSYPKLDQWYLQFCAANVETSLRLPVCPFLLTYERKVEQLKVSSSARGGKQYWIDSAKRLGLVDTPHGIHLVGPVWSFASSGGPSATAEAKKKKRAEARAAIKAEVKPPIEDTVDEDN